MKRILICIYLICLFLLCSVSDIHCHSIEDDWKLDSEWQGYKIEIISGEKEVLYSGMLYTDYGGFLWLKQTMKGDEIILVPKPTPIKHIIVNEKTRELKIYVKGETR